MLPRNLRTRCEGCGASRRLDFLPISSAIPTTVRYKNRLHVAIIMDGNGRWATRRRLPRTAGHRAGSRALRAILETAPELGIDTLTLFAFSSDNWKRPAVEV